MVWEGGRGGRWWVSGGGRIRAKVGRCCVAAWQWCSRSLLRGRVVIGPALSHVCAIRRSRVVRRKVGWRTVVGGEPQAASNMAFKRDLPNRCESKMVVASEPWRDLSTVFGRHLNAGVRRMGTTL
jgi:hypothetical protein